MRNPGNPQRHIEANERRTLKRVETYYGKNDILRTWELMPKPMQADEHDYLLGLRKRVRDNRNMLLHRADPNADL